MVFVEAIKRKCNANIHWSGLYNWGYIVHVIHFHDKAIRHKNAKTSTNNYFSVASLKVFIRVSVILKNMRLYIYDNVIVCNKQHFLSSRKTDVFRIVAVWWMSALILMAKNPISQDNKKYLNVTMWNSRGSKNPQLHNILGLVV